MILNSVKLKVLQKLGRDARTCADLARRIGKDKSEVSHVLAGRRFTPDTQEKIARYLGMPVQGLFGEWAWFRVAARKLKARQRQAG